MVVTAENDAPNKILNSTSWKLNLRSLTRSADALSTELNPLVLQMKHTIFKYSVCERKQQLHVKYLSQT